MGVKAAVLAGLLLPLLLLLFFSSPLVDGVYQCSDPNKSDLVNCEVGQEKYCFAVKCKKEKEKGKAEAYGCGGKATRLEACKELDKKYCSDKEGIKKGPEGCQLCTGEKCNKDELADGGDWDNPDHKPTTASPITTTTKKRPATITTTKKRPPTPTTTKNRSATSPPTTTTKKVTAKPTDKGTNGGATKDPGGEEENGTDGGHHFGVNSLLLIAGSLLAGLISHSAILLR